MSKGVYLLNAYFTIDGIQRYKSNFVAIGSNSEIVLFLQSAMNSLDESASYYAGSSLQRRKKIYVVRRSGLMPEKFHVLAEPS